MIKEKTMKKIGIIGAMDEEILALRNEMEQVKETEVASMTFCEGILSGKEVVLVRSGIGKVNMAVCAQILATQFQVDCVLNTGIAGSLCNDINIGDIVISTDAMQHDFDATVFGYKKGEIPRMETSTFVADEAMVALAKKVCEEVNKDISVFTGRVVSGDQFISNDEVKNAIVENFNGLCTEMEGASMAQVAWLNRLPFVIIRAISDKADHSAEVDYDEFEAKAIEHTVKLVRQMVKEMEA